MAGSGSTLAAPDLGISHRSAGVVDTVDWGTGHWPRQCEARDGGSVEIGCSCDAQVTCDGLDSGVVQTRDCRASQSGVAGRVQRAGSGEVVREL